MLPLFVCVNPLVFFVDSPLLCGTCILVGSVEDNRKEEINESLKV